METKQNEIKAGTKPKIRLYCHGEGDKLEELIALWENKDKKGGKYYTGKLGKVRIVGFENIEK